MVVRFFGLVLGCDIVDPYEWLTPYNNINFHLHLSLSISNLLLAKLSDSRASNLANCDCLQREDV